MIEEMSIFANQRNYDIKFLLSLQEKKTPYTLINSLLIPKYYCFGRNFIGGKKIFFKAIVIPIILIRNATHLTFVNVFFSLNTI